VACTDLSVIIPPQPLPPAEPCLLQYSGLPTLRLALSSTKAAQWEFPVTNCGMRKADVKGAGSGGGRPAPWTRECFWACDYENVSAETIRSIIRMYAATEVPMRSCVARSGVYVDKVVSASIAPVLKGPPLRRDSDGFGCNVSRDQDAFRPRTTGTP